MQSRMAPVLIAFAIALLLSGCVNRDPYRRTDVWRPNGSNAANLAAMVADPHDLIRGRDTNQPHSSKDLVIPVQKLWQGAPTAALGGGGSASTGSGGSSGG